jgi:hypothetical protein
LASSQSTNPEALVIGLGMGAGAVAERKSIVAMVHRLAMLLRCMSLGCESNCDAGLAPDPQN